MLNFGVEVGIYNKKTKGFLRFDLESRRIKADSIHPFLKVGSRDVSRREGESREGDAVCLEEFRIYSEKDPSSKGIISFGAHVYIVNR